MNKKLLLLAGILAVSATTMAAEEATTAPAFKATGYYNGHLKLKADGYHFTKHKYGKNDHDSKIELQNEAGAQLTEKFGVSVEAIRKINFPGKDRSREREVTFTGTYNNGKIGGSDLTLKQSFSFHNESEFGDDRYRYEPRLDFASYIGGTAGFFLLQFDHLRNDGQAGFKAGDAVRYDLGGTWDLGAGFAFDAELDGTFLERTYDEAIMSGHKKDMTKHELLLGVKYNKNLYAAGKNSIDLYADLYDESNYKKTKDGLAKVGTTTTTTSKTNKLTSEVAITFSHQLNSASKIYLKPGVEAEYGLYTNDDANKDAFKRDKENAYLELGFNVTL